jgi:hypothetical protein
LFYLENAEKMVDASREVIGSQHRLVKWFSAPDGTRDAKYAAKVKKRFVQWVRRSYKASRSRAASALEAHTRQIVSNRTPRYFSSWRFKRAMFQTSADSYECPLRDLG